MHEDGLCICTVSAQLHSDNDQEEIEAGMGGRPIRSCHDAPACHTNVTDPLGSGFHTSFGTALNRQTPHRILSDEHPTSLYGMRF